MTTEPAMTTRTLDRPTEVRAVRRPRRRLARRAGVYGALIAGGVAMTIPFLWMVAVSLKTRAERRGELA